MKHLKFFIFQSAYFSVFIALDLCLRAFINSPITITDLIVAGIFVVLVILIIKPMNWFYEPFSTIRFRVKLLLSIPAFFLAFLFGGLLILLIFGGEPPM